MKSETEQKRNWLVVGSNPSQANSLSYFKESFSGEYYIYIYIYIYIYTYVCMYVCMYVCFTTERFFEVAIESWSE